jgi:hypothetical protein
MINCSIAMKAHLAGSHITMATCWKVTQTYGTLDSPVAPLGFTNHDQDITFLGVTYRASTGFSGTDVASGSDMSVDNMEAMGMLVSPAITEADLEAGLWDFAEVEMFMVNWADLTMGKLVLRKGHIGEVSLERGSFKAEVRGQLQAYSRTIGELTSAGCRAELFDARCKVDPSSFTVVGAIEGVNNDLTALYDSARTEAGPTNGIAITDVSRANPGVVRVADASTLSNGQAVQLSGIVGPDQLNTVTFVRNLDTDHFHFDLPISTLSMPTYISGGTVTPLGGDSGYFDFGVITFLDGLNVGRSMEIRAYVPGQMILQLPMPYAVQVGDAYMMRAGCDKSLSTCLTRFANVINMRAEPYLPGLDKLVSVGTQ